MWVLGVPFALSAASVWLISPGPDDDVGVLRQFVGGQRVPAGILFFLVFAAVLWRFRYDLPLSNGISPGRRDLPPKARARFEEAMQQLTEARGILKTKKKDVERELTSTERDQLEHALGELERTMTDTPFNKAQFDLALGRAERSIGEHLSRWRKLEIREYAEAILIAVALAGLARVVLIEPFKIPTGSMIPTLLIGDHIFVNKWSYGPLIPYTDRRLFTSLPPERGDVMVFKFPENMELDYIKRVIGEPGDSIEVFDGRPVINGWLVPHCHVGTMDSGFNEGPHELYVEFLNGRSYFTQFLSTSADRECKSSHDCANGLMCKFGVCGSVYRGPYKVPTEQVFVMGDNRDNSQDSRFWFNGQGAGVPFANIKGRAMFIAATFSPDKDTPVPPFSDRFLINVVGRPALPPNQLEMKPQLDQCLKTMPSNTTPPVGK